MKDINTLTKKGAFIMPDFDNGIFRTIPHDTVDGAVWLVRVADGERITFCRTQDDVMFCVAELMKQRLGLWFVRDGYSSYRIKGTAGVIRGLAEWLLNTPKNNLDTLFFVW